MENSTIPRTIYNSELTEPTKDILFLTFPGTSQNSDIITAYNEIDAVYGTDKIICSLTLKPGHQYLILCNLTTSDSDSSSIMGASLKCVGDARVIGGATARTTMHSGGGCANWMFVEPTVDVTINLYGYGYSGKTYKYMGTLMAIQLR